MDDYKVLRKLFPEYRDFFHINGKFVFDVRSTPDRKWVLGLSRRKRLTDLGFRWFIENQKLWIYDR